MYRLDAALSAALAAGHTVIVPNRQRAAAVRLAHAWRQHAAGRPVWATPDVIAWEAWLARELARARQVRGDGAVLLNVSQQHALWQQVLGRLEVPAEEREALMRHAEAIASAATQVREWHLTWPEAGAPHEAVLLLHALRGMDAACQARGVLIAGLARPEDLADLQPADLLFAGFAALTPRQAAVARQFAAAGRQAQCHEVAPPGASPTARSFADAAGEIAAAGQWCRERLEADPAARLLVICADTRSDPGVVRNGLLALVDPARTAPAGSDLVIAEGGEPLSRHGLVATALAILRLGAGDIEFAPLGSLLLSPFHSLAVCGEAVRLELWLRDRLPQRTTRAALLEQLGTAPAACQGAAGGLRAALTASAACYSLPRTRPLDWAQRWSDVLRGAGHPGSRPASSEESQAWLRWQGALEEFASLDELLGPIAAADAMNRLEGLVNRSHHQAATGDAPVTVTRSRGDPVVAYDGIWVLGLNESQCPEPPRPDPFLPYAAQRVAGLPAASTALRLAAARGELAAWAARSTTLVLSYPRSEGDLDPAPSVLLHGLPVETRHVGRSPWLAPGEALREAAALSLPPIAAPGGLRAGSKLPELQRECPFRAQAELRLRARGLAAPRIGIDPRLRGLLLHRALERLWNVIGSSAVLRSRPPAMWTAEVAAAVDAALAAPESAFGVPPTARERARERDRCRELLLETLALEAARPGDFTVVESERRVNWQVAGAQLVLRIDRLDRLADGSLAVIDYKTGAQAIFDLHGAAPRPVQLLAYLDALCAAGEGDVSALALLKLVPGKVHFRAAEDGRAGLPVPRARGGGSVPLPWATQLAAWRADVEDLVRQHIAGDARVQPLPRACEYCHLPALCRIDAQTLAATLEASAPDDDAAESGS